jgi:hypothetical protein
MEYIQTFFGVSRGLDRTERDAIVNYLREAWYAQYNQSPSTLSVDLEILSSIFRSHVQAKRLRDAAENLSPIVIRRPLLPEAVFVAVDDRRGFVTPEGRVLLEYIQTGNVATSKVISRDDMVQAYAVIAEFYGSNHRRWMRKELAGGDVRPGTIGFVVFLLINNSVGKDRALYLPTAQADEEALAKTILPCVNVFTVGIGGGEIKQRESGRLRSNWIVTESNRQMPRYISRLDEQRGVKYWIEPNTEQELIDELGAHIARRKMVSGRILDEALQAARSEYETARPMLASWGLSHERAGHTRQVMDRLLTSYHRSVRV